MRHERAQVAAQRREVFVGTARALLRGTVVAGLVALAPPIGAQPAPVTAQTPAGAAQTPAPSHDPAIVPACLTEAAGDPVKGAGCIGVAASHCIEGLGDMIESAAITACYRAEADQWGGQMAETLVALSDLAAASDAAEAAGPGLGRRAALEVAQAAWDTWRTAECAAARRLAQGGGGEDPAEASCLLRLTGARALGLAAILNAQRGP